MYFLLFLYNFALKYPSFGKIFITFLQENASEGALILMGLEKEKTNKHSTISTDNITNVSAYKPSFRAKAPYSTAEFDTLVSIKESCKVRIALDKSLPPNHGSLFDSVYKKLLFSERMNPEIASLILNEAAKDPEFAKKYLEIRTPLSTKSAVSELLSGSNTTNVNTTNAKTATSSLKASLDFDSKKGVSVSLGVEMPDPKTGKPKTYGASTLTEIKIRNELYTSEAASVAAEVSADASGATKAKLETKVKIPEKIAEALPTAIPRLKQLAAVGATAGAIGVRVSNDPDGAAATLNNARVAQQTSGIQEYNITPSNSDD
jgi:hypothetical protein